VTATTLVSGAGAGAEVMKLEAEADAVPFYPVMRVEVAVIKCDFAVA
jgi:hypothetical protein